MAVMARKIWLRRNSVVHGGDFIHPSILFREASSSLEEFRRVNSHEPVVQYPLLVVPTILWHKPSSGKLKINWDVAVDKGHGRIGVGIIVRDHEGFVLAAHSTTKNILVEPVVAKALAALYAVNFCREMNFYDILMEGDALQIVSAVKMESKYWSRYGHIVDGIKVGLHTLRSWHIDHVKRDANTTAHSLAQEAILSVIDKVYIE